MLTGFYVRKHILTIKTIAEYKERKCNYLRGNKHEYMIENNILFIKINIKLPLDNIL